MEISHKLQHKSYWVFEIPASFCESVDRRMAGLFLLYVPCRLSYIGFTSLCQFSEAKGNIFNLWVLKTGGVREFLSLSICSYFLPLCFWKQPWVPVPAERCNGAPAPGHYSLMAAVHIRGKEVAGMASRINYKLKNFKGFFFSLKDKLRSVDFLWL